MKSEIPSANSALVIGGAGYIGSHLCEALVEAGYSVTSLDNYTTGRKTHHVAEVAYVEGDSNDIDQLLLPTVDFVFHLGEYARVESSFKNLDQVFHSNIRGTSKVLEYCLRTKTKLIYAGSSTQFAPQIQTDFASPYSIAKSRNTSLIRDIASLDQLPYAICYFHNVYGGREYRSGLNATVIGLFTEALIHGRHAEVVLPGTQTRFFTHVDDIVRGIILCAEKGSGDGYQIGADESFSVAEVAALFGLPVEWLPSRPGNRLEATIDTSRIRALGWQPTNKLPEHIESVKKSAMTAWPVDIDFVGASCLK